MELDNLEAISENRTTENYAFIIMLKYIVRNSEQENVVYY